VRSWQGRIDEEGQGALVRMAEPVNKFPDFVRYLVRELKALPPAMGKLRIAQVLARAGLHLGATTVGRMLRETEPVPEESVASGEIGIVETRVITATRPDEIWHVDLTTVPTAAGFWVPWLPFTWPQAWPFCWWVAVVVDHFSRAVVGFAVFFRSPTSAEVQRSLGLAIQRAGLRPQYVISDQGRQFRCKSFQRWCRRQGIRPRFGAVGEYGRLAVIERFMRSLKAECTRQNPGSAAAGRHAPGDRLVRHLAQPAPAEPGAERADAVGGSRRTAPGECEPTARTPSGLAEWDPVCLAADGDPRPRHEARSRRRPPGRQDAPARDRASRSRLSLDPAPTLTTTAIAIAVEGRSSAPRRR